MKIDVFRSASIKLIGYRSSQRRCSVKKGILKNSQENPCAGVSFLTTLLKKRLQHRYFLMNFTKFFRTPFFRTPLVASEDIYLYYCWLHRKFLFLFHSNYRFSNSLYFFCLHQTKVSFRVKYLIVCLRRNCLKGRINCEIFLSRHFMKY